MVKLLQQLLLVQLIWHLLCAIRKISCLVPSLYQHMAKKDVGHRDTQVLENGYAWKPGLYSLIKYAKSAKSEAQNIKELESKIQLAIKTYNSSQVDEDSYAKVIFELRKAIRNSGTSQGKSLIINRFPTDPLY